MNLADKIISLRKQQGWSQEELAEKLDVSRQSVSKWEGGQSTPDISKIVALSDLFCVSTDYLLKEESQQIKLDPQPKRYISMEDAKTFLALRRQAAPRIALATFLCILSPVTMFTLLALGEDDLNLITLNENAASGIGMAVLFLLISAACPLFLQCASRIKSYEFLDSEDFDTQYGVAVYVRQTQQDFLPAYSRCNMIGTVLCILSVIPLMLAAFSGGEGLCILGLCALMVIAGTGVLFFIYAGVIWASTEKLLKEGDYTLTNKRINEKISASSWVFWIVTGAIYLAWSFTENFAVSWILWPVNGLLYAAFVIILRQILRSKFQNT